MSFFICVERFVDPDLVGTAAWFGGLAHEAFGVDAIGGIENSLTLFEDERGLVVVDHGRREQAQPGVAMFLVVPAEKSLRKSAAVLNAAETVWELWAVLQGAELTFRIRIVVRDVRTAVCFGDAQIGQQEGHRLGTHRGAAIGMQRELAGLDVLFRATLRDQSLEPVPRFRACATIQPVT